MNYEDRVTKEYVEGLLAGMPKVYAGTYIGTGTCGPSHPTSITFPFTPKLVIINIRAGHASWGTDLVLMWGLTATHAIENTNYQNIITYSGNTISWHITQTENYATEQLNANGRVYPYIAIG